MNSVTNETFEAAWADENNRRIIAKVCRRYSKQIPKEELVFRGYMGLFNCLRKHNPSHTTKFTSSLHRHVVWQCRQAVRHEARHPPYAPLPEEYEPAVLNRLETIYVRECVDMLPPKHAEMLRSYYFESMTLQEIGIANGYTTPAASQKLRQAEEAFRRLYGED